jgi:phage-related protein
MSLISNLDIILRGNTGGLSTSLTKGITDVGSFRDKVRQAAAQTNASLSNIGRGVSDSIASAIQNPVAALSAIGSQLLNAVLHPIDTVKGAISGFLATSRQIGETILGNLESLTGIASIVIAPIKLISNAITGLYSLVKPIIIPITSVGLSIVGAALMALPKAGSFMLNVIGSVAVGLLKGGLMALPHVGNFLMTVGSIGIGLLKGGLASLPHAGNFILTVGSIGIGLLKGGLASLPHAGSFILSVVSVGMGLIKNALVSLAKPILVPIGLSGLSVITGVLPKIGAMALGLIQPFTNLNMAIFAIGQDLAKTVMLASPIAAAIGHSLMPIAPLIVASFEQAASVIGRVFAPQITFVKGLFLSLYTSIKPIVVSMALRGWELVRAGVMGLYGLVRPILMPVALTGLAVARASLDLLKLPSRIIVNLALQGYDLVRTAIASLPKAGSFIVRAAAAGLDVIRTAIVSLPQTGSFIVKAAASGLSVITSAIALLPKAGTYLLSVAASGLSVVKSAIAALPKATSFIVHVMAAGLSLVKSVIMSLPKVASFILQIGMKGYDVVNTAIAALAKAPSVIVSFASKGFDLVMRGIQGVVSGLSSIGKAAAGGMKSLLESGAGALSSLLTMASGAGIAATAIGGVTIGLVALGAVLVGTGIAFTILAAKQATVIGQMQKTASVLGMTTQSFSALSSSMGMDTESFSSGMEHLERVLSEAQQTSGPTAQALARVGLEAHSLTSIDPNEQLNRIANSMMGMASQADRLRLATELFGRGMGGDFVAALQNGQAGLDVFRQRAERFGLSVTDSQAQMVRQSNRVWSEWSLGLVGIGRQLAYAFSPIWEFVGRQLGDFFAKLGQWTKAAVPYIERIWEVTSEVLSDIGSALEPVRSWFVNAFEGIGEFIGATITKGIPFVREAWNIIKAITSVAWDAFSSIISAAWGVVRPIIEGIGSTVSSVFSSIVDALGLSGDTFDSFLQKALAVFVALEWGITNWERVGSLAWDSIKLKMLEWADGLSSIASTVESFINTLIDGFSSLASGISRVLGGTINNIIDRYNQVADTIGMRRINFRIDLDAVSLDHVNLGVHGLEDQIADLRTSVNQQLTAINSDLAAFIDQRLAELNRVAQRTQQAAQQATQIVNPPVQKIDNKAAEKGSAEAYSIMVGQQGDKMYNVLNDILRQLQNAAGLDREQLQELRRRQLLAVARF